MCTNFFRGLGKQKPLCLLHDPFLQNFRGVPLLDFHRFLGDNLTAVGNLIDKMHRCTGDFHAVIQCRLMHPQSIKALAAKCGDQTGMDIQNPLGIVGCKFFRQDGHKSGQNDDIDGVSVQNFHQFFFKGGLAAQFLFDHHFRGDAGLFRPFQGIGPGDVGDDQFNFSAFQHAPLGIDQGLQIGAATGYQNCDPCTHFRITCSSDSIILPIT